MVNSTWIPSSYTTRWRAARRQSLPQPPTKTTHNPHMPVYNSSCTYCTRSRVRCSGGKPCERCEKNFSDPILCVYEPSRRHGKRRARESGVDTLLNSAGTDQQPASSVLPWQDSPLNTILNVDSLLGDLPLELNYLAPFASTQPYRTFDDGSQSSTTSVINLDTLSIDQSLFAAEPFDGISNDSDTTSPPPLPCSSNLSSVQFEGSDENIYHPSTRCLLSESCDCHRSTQALLSRLTSASVEPGKVGLDEILLSFHQASQHAVNYLNCIHCEGGYPRLINLAMLHQSEVTLLCKMANNSAAYFGFNHGPDIARFTLGAYQLPEADDLHQKRLAILAVGRKVESLVADFDAVIGGHQELLESAGGLGESDLAKINLKWLLEVAGSLKTQLESALTIFEQADLSSWEPGNSY